VSPDESQSSDPRASGARVGRKSLFVVVGAAAALVLAGCQVDQKKEVAQYRRVLDDNHLPKVQDYGPPPTEAMTLVEAMSLANKYNENLGLSGEDYVQALIDKNRAVANFLPTVSFQPNYTIGQKPGGTITSSPGTPLAGTFRVVGNTEQRLEAPVVGSINLFNGGGDVARLRATEAIIAQRRELLLNLQATILLNVAQTYYQILRSEREVAVLRHSLELQTARLNDVTQQFNNGLATRFTVAQTRAQVDATRVTLVQAESDVRNGRAVLAGLVGTPRPVANRLADTFAVPDEIGDERAWEQRGLANRQDLKATRHALEAAKQNVKVQVSQYWPSVGLDVEGFLYRESFADAAKWYALLTVNVPIFSAGRIEADVRTAWSQLRQAALEESATRRQILQDVQVAYENFQTSERRIAELSDEVRAADDAYRQSLGAFQNGLAINLDVLTSLDQLLNAQLNLAAASYDRTVFYLDLIRATGELTNTVAPPPPAAATVATTAGPVPATQPVTH
jgi:outer membrane protein